MKTDINRTYIPMSDRDNYGNLTFPTLSDKAAKSPTISDLASEDVDVTQKLRTARQKRVSKSNRRMIDKLGTSAEYRQVRYNMSYKPVLDIIGEDFPLHPEYLYVIDIICKYYGTTIMDVLEYGQMSEMSRMMSAEHTAVTHRVFNLNVLTCMSCICYFLYVQYKCNPITICEVFAISVQLLRSQVESFARAYANSKAIQADYSILYGRLIQLEKNNL